MYFLHCGIFRHFKSDTGPFQRAFIIKSYTHCRTYGGVNFDTFYVIFEYFCIVFVSFDLVTYFRFFSLIFSSFSFHFFSGLAFVAGLKRATDEGSLPEISQYSPYYLSLNILLLPKDQTFIFHLLLQQLVLCYVAVRTSSIVQFIFLCRLFEISKDIQRVNTRV